MTAVRDVLRLATGGLLWVGLPCSSCPALHIQYCFTPYMALITHVMLRWDLDELGDTPPAPLCDGGSRTLGMKYNLKLNPQLFC